MIVSGITTFFMNDIVPFVDLIKYRIECNRTKMFLRKKGTKTRNMA